MLKVSISPVRLIRSVRLTSTFSLSFSSSCQEMREIETCLMITERSKLTIIVNLKSDDAGMILCIDSCNFHTPMKKILELSPFCT